MMQHKLHTAKPYSCGGYFFCIIKICVNLERGKKSNTYFRNAHNTKLHFGKHSKKYEASNCKKKDKVKLPISVREEGTNLF